MKRLIFLLLTLVSYGCFSQDDLKLSNEATSNIDALFADFDNLESPGYAVGVSKNGNTIYADGFGSANLDYNLPIQQSSSFNIASVSKQFTAACIALLILDGSLSLEDPASKFVPELSKYSETILVKHLIYNSSGIQDYYRLPRENGASWITFNYFDIDECIQTALRENRLQFKPGERWDYCNVNFMLLTKIVEKVSGQSFSSFAKEKLFQPLDMSSTFINDDMTAVVKNRVTPYNLRTAENIESYTSNGINIKSEGDYIQHHRNSPHYGGSGVVTTIEDMLKWSKNMLTHDFGGKEFYELMHATPKFEHDRTNQAFGLYIGDFNGRKIVAWDGGDWGVSAQLMRFPDSGVAIVVLSNLGSGESFRKVNAIADILVEEGIIE